MKILLLFSVVIFISFVGCAKQENEPSTPVLNLYKAATAGDSVGMMKSIATVSRQQILSTTDTAFTVRHQIEDWKGTHADIKILETRIDKTLPNMAKVYFSAKFTGGKNNYTMDSVYFIVAKEDNEWRVSSINPLRDPK